MAVSYDLDDSVEVFLGQLGARHGSGYELFVICSSLFLANQIINVTVQKWEGPGNQISAFQVFTVLNKTLIFRGDELVYEFTKRTPTVPAELDVLLIVKPAKPFGLPC